VKLSDLTDGEKLLIYRRRRDMSQRAAAFHYDVTLYRYRQWETGKEDGAPPVSLKRLEQHEIYFLRRIRAGIPLKVLAAKLDVSRWWLTKMETGRAPCTRLARYWTEREPVKPWRPAILTGT
jgi:DNA-binding transcriptional regulator YiaG